MKNSQCPRGDGYEPEKNKQDIPKEARTDRPHNYFINSATSLHPGGSGCFVVALGLACCSVPPAFFVAVWASNHGGTHRWKLVLLFFSPMFPSFRGGKEGDSGRTLLEIPRFRQFSHQWGGFSHQWGTRKFENVNNVNR